MTNNRVRKQTKKKRARERERRRRKKENHHRKEWKGSCLFLERKSNQKKKSLPAFTYIYDTN